MQTVSKRVKKEIELLDRVASAPLGSRKDVLERIALEEGVSYNALKQRLEALAYASLESPQELPRLDRMPKTMKRRVAAYRSLLRKGVIPVGVARTAAARFVNASVWRDPERVKRDVQLGGTEAVKMVDSITSNMRKIAVLRQQESGAPTMRVVSRTWNIVGNILHNELPKVLAATPVERRPQAVRDLVRSAFLKSQALVQYEHARSAVLKYYRENKERLPPKPRGFYDTMAKNLQRWNDPGKAFRKIGYKFEDESLKLLSRLPKSSIPVIESLPFKPTVKMRGLVGRHVRAGRTIMTDFHRVRRENPDLKSVLAAKAGRSRKR